MFKKIKENLFLSGLIAAATIGAGLFALPGVFNASGWGIALVSMALVAACIIFAHRIFWETLHKSDGAHGLLGLVRARLGARAGFLAFWAIVGGLTLTLAAYLNLGGEFLRVIFPGLGASALSVFWIIASFPALFSLKRFAKLEAGVVSVMAAIILFIFFSAPEKTAIFNSPFVLPGGAFISFGALLFSLSGWTAIEPIAKLTREKNFNRKPFFIALGTIFAAILFLLFVAGIFGSTQTITGDTISGLLGWPAWRLKALALLGLFTIFSVHTMISAEIKNSLHRDSRWEETTAVAFVIFAPLILVLAGLNKFQEIVSLAGGVFLATQYFFIVLVSKESLKLKNGKKLFANLLLIIFALSAIYEAYRFLMK